MKRFIKNVFTFLVILFILVGWVFGCEGCTEDNDKINNKCIQD